MQPLNVERSGNMTCIKLKQFPLPSSQQTVHVIF